MILTLPDEAATARLGQAIAPMLQAGDAVLLRGELGAGKSTLARALIRALTTPDEDVPSPTFTLVQSYGSTPPIAHFDLYRLAGPAEALEIGLVEALDEGCVLVEWPERLEDEVEALLGADRLEVSLTIEGEGRRASVSGAGRWQEAIQHVRL